MPSHRSAILLLLVGAFSTAGCGAVLRNMNPGHEFGEDKPPPPPESSGEQAAVFAKLATNEPLFRQWLVMESAARGELGGPVIPQTARFLRAYVVAPLWDEQVNKLGHVVGRWGYFAVLYREDKACVWVRARFYQRHYGGGKFGAPELTPFEAGSFDTRLPAVTRDERKYRYACTE